MGATLRYAKVVDRDEAHEHGGLTPATDNVVRLAGAAPATARDFVIARAWDGVEGGVEERWRLEDTNGHVVYRGVPRTVLANDGDIYDEIRGVRFEYADDDYQLVLEIDDREVARTDFAVVTATGTPPTSDAGVPITDGVPPDTGGAGDASVAPGEGSPEQQPNTTDLSDVDQTVLQAVSTVEVDAGPGFAADIAEAAGTDLDTVRAALSRLTGEAGLVQELTADAGEGSDLGPRYRIKARP